MWEKKKQELRKENTGDARGEKETDVREEETGIKKREDRRWERRSEVCPAQTANHGRAELNAKRHPSDGVPRLKADRSA